MNKTHYYAWHGSVVVTFTKYIHKRTMSETLNIPTKIFSRKSTRHTDTKTYNILIKL